MGQDVLVIGYEEDGRALIDRVRATGFPIVTAFWAKLSERSDWNLFLVSPFVDENGAVDAYNIIHPIMQQHPEVAIDWQDVRVIGARYGMATDVAAIQKAKPFARPIRVRGGTLGGRDLDEAYIYPPLTPTA